MKRLLSFLITVCLGFTGLVSKIQAQDDSYFCGFDELHEQMLKEVPEYAASIEAYDKAFARYMATKGPRRAGEKAEVVTIPIVFHVVHIGEEVGEGSNITDEQVYSCIDGMNIQYRNLNPDGTPFDPDGTDLEFEFCIAQRDPDGNPTTGVVHVDGRGVPDYEANGISQQTNNQQIKDLSRWDPTRYYNVWVVQKINGQEPFGGGTKGYAQLGPNPKNSDGTVVLFNEVGYDPGGTKGLKGNGQLSNRAAEENSTMVHEVGHAFSLYHTWNGGDSNGNNCPPAENDCSTSGDRVCDTAPHRSHLSGPCKTGETNACTGQPLTINETRNYMNYTNCTNLIYTPGQRDRVRFSLENARTNFNNPGTPEACVPVFAHDISIKKLFNPQGFYCNGNVVGEILVKNNGQNPIDSFAIDYGVDGITDSIFMYRGRLESQDEIAISLPGITTSTSTHTFFAQVAPNSINDNQPDEFQSNDRVDGNFEVIDGSPVRLVVDNYEGADRFEIVDVAGNITASGNFAGVSGTFDQEFCLPSEKCYTFKFYDAIFIHPQVGGTPPDYRLISVDNGYEITSGISPFPGFTGGPYQTESEEFCMPFDPGFVIADFSLSQKVIETNSPVNFFDESVTGSGEAADTWMWDFGDGASSTQKNPTHSYANDGVYTVSLTANNGLEPNTAEKIHVIRVVNELEDCEQYKNILQGENSRVIENFDGASGTFPGNNAFGIDEYAERFYAPDKNKLVKAVINIKEINSDDLSRELIVSVYDGGFGGAKPISILHQTRIPLSELTVGNNTIDFDPFPEVNRFYFIGYKEADVADEVIVGAAPFRAEEDLSSTAYVKVNGAWSLIDSVATEANATALDISASLSLIPSPKALADVTKICAGNEFNVIGTASTNFTSLLWKFGDDASRSFSTKQEEAITYFEGGEKEIYLVASGGCNLKDSALVTVTVDSVPEVEFAITNDVCDQGNGTATAVMKGGSGSFQFEWSFNGTFQGNTHADANAGFYTYTWSDPSCNVIDRVENYEVESQNVVAEFDLEANKTTCGNQNGRASVITDGLLNYEIDWSKSDDSTFSSTTSNIFLLDSGMYVVTVSFDGCDSKVDSIEVLPSRKTTGTVAEIPMVCPGIPVTLHATGGDSLKWFDAKGEIFANNIDTLLIDTINTARFDVVFYGDSGCTLTKKTGVNISPNAKARGVVSNGFEDYSDTAFVDLKDDELTLFSSAGSFSRGLEWDFGDGTPLTTERNPTHKYTEAGAYQVILYAYNNGCDDADTNMVMVDDTRVVSIATNSSVAYKVFPNPASTVINITSGTTVNQADVTVMDVSGKIIWNASKTQWNEIIIPLDQVNAGIYFLKVKTTSGEFQSKISVIE